MDIKTQEDLLNYVMRLTALDEIQWETQGEQPHGGGLQHLSILPNGITIRVHEDVLRILTSKKIFRMRASALQDLLDHRQPLPDWVLNFTQPAAPSDKADV